MHALLLPLLLSIGEVRTANPDIAVVCPTELREAMQPWLARRTKQGHVVRFVSNLGTAEKIRDEIRLLAKSGNLHFVLLVGDAMSQHSDDVERVDRPRRTPTFRVPSKVTRYWGGTTDIASDNPYADLDDDGLPDLAIGRLSARSAEKLSVMLAKILTYEDSCDFGPWRTRLNLIVGQATYRPMADSFAESVAWPFIAEGVPASYRPTITCASWSSPYCPDPHHFHSCCLEQMHDGALFWVFMGHGLPRTLQWAAYPDTHTPILESEDCAHLHCGATPPIALCFCCLTGAFAENEDCLAEELVRAPGGPVAVLASSSLSMPYGMAMLGRAAMYEYFDQRRPTIGEWLLYAKRDTMAFHSSPIWCLINAVTVAALPPGIDFKAERLEHVQLFNLLGDPTMRLPQPQTVQLSVQHSAAKARAINVQGQSPVAGAATVELVSSVDQCRIPLREHYPIGSKSGEEFDAVYRAANDHCLAATTLEVRAGRFSCDLPLPKCTPGRYHVRIFVQGADDFAVGTSEVQAADTDASPAAPPAPKTAAAAGRDQSR